jgi:hypothetical protein
MKQQSKLSREQQQHAEVHQTQKQAGQEFASAEELLRFDAAQTAVPPQIGEKLKRSAAKIEPPKAGWFKRLFK